MVVELTINRTIEELKYDPPSSRNKVPNAINRTIEELKLGKDIDSAGIFGPLIAP